MQCLDGQEQRVWREKEALGLGDSKKKGKDGKENAGDKTEKAAKTDKAEKPKDTKK